MKKVLYVIMTVLLTICLASPMSYAGKTRMYLLGATAGESDLDLFTDILFWHNFENTTHVNSSYSVGDMSPFGWNVGGFMSYSNGKLYGNGTYQGAFFYVVDDDIVSSESGRVGFWWKCTTHSNTQGIWGIDNNGADHLWVYTAPGNELWVAYKDAASGNENAFPTVGANLVAGNYYFIEIIWDLTDPSSSDFEVKVDGNSVTSTSFTDANANQPFSTQRTWFGNWLWVAAQYWFDNMMISSDTTRDLHALRNLVCFPGLYSYPDLTFFWTANIGTVAPHSYSSGDDRSVTTGGVSIHPTGRVGNDCLRVTSSPAGHAAFDLSEGQIIGAEKGRVGYWLRVNTYPPASTFPNVWSAEESANNYIRSVLSTSYLYHHYRIDPGGDEGSVSFELTGNDWNYMEIAYDTTLGSSSYMKAYMNGVLMDTDVGAITSSSFTTGSLNLGDTVGYTGPLSYDVDLFVTSDDPDRDLYLLADRQYNPRSFVDKAHDIRFFWRMEGATTDANYDTNAGSQPTYGFNVSFPAAAAKVGNAGMQAFAGLSYAQFATYFNLHVDVDGGSIAYWFQPVLWQINQFVYHIATATSENIYVYEIYPGALPLNMFHFGDTGEEVSSTTWYWPGWHFQEQSWIQDISGISSAAATWKDDNLDLWFSQFWNVRWQAQALNIGNIGTAEGWSYYDNFMFSADPLRKLYNYRCFNRTPKWSPTARQWEVDWLLFWRCEATTMVTPNNDYTGNTGNLTWSLSGGATITSAAARLGTNGLRVSGASSYATYDPGTNDEALNKEQGRIGAWVRINSYSSAGTLFDVVIDADNQWTIIADDGGTDLKFLWEEGGVVEVGTSADGMYPNPISVGVWYFIEFAWCSCTPERIIYVNGDPVLIDRSDFDMMPSTGDIRIGNVIGTEAGTIIDFDQIMVSDDYRREFYDFRGKQNFGE